MEENYQKYLEEKFRSLSNALKEIRTTLNDQTKLMENTKDELKDLRNIHSRDISDLSKMINASANTSMQEILKVKEQLEDEIYKVKNNSNTFKAEINYRFKTMKIIEIIVLIALILIFVEESREYIIHSILGFLGLPH